MHSFLPPQVSRPQFAVAALAAAMLTLAAGCQRPPDAPRKQVAPVRVKEVRRDKVWNQVRLVGTVVPLDVSMVESGAQGKVMHFDAREGDRIGGEQLLAKLRDKTINIEIEAAKAKQRNAAAALKLAVSNRDRVRNLFARKSVNKADKEEAESQAEQAKAADDAAKQEVLRLQDELSKREIKSPFKSDMVYLVKKHTNVGEWLDRGGAVATLADLSWVEVVVTVEENFVGLLEPGQQVEVYVDALRTTRQGMIKHIVPQADWRQGSRSYPVRVRIQNELDGKDQPLLKEGMLARVTLTGPKRQSLLVHKDCIVRSTGQSVVYKVGEDRRVRPVRVEEGIIHGEEVEVTVAKDQPHGLAEGEKLVADGAERVRPMQEVEVKASEASS